MLFISVMRLTHAPENKQSVCCHHGFFALISALGVYFTLAQEGTITEGDATLTPSLPFIPLENLPPEQPLPTASPMPTLLPFDAEGLYTEDTMGAPTFDPAAFAPTSGNLIQNGNFSTGINP
jgi:hypothetical protein